MKLRPRSLHTLAEGRLFQTYTGFIYVITEKRAFARHLRDTLLWRDVPLTEFWYSDPLAEILPSFAGPVRLRELKP